MNRMPVYVLLHSDQGLTIKLFPVAIITIVFSLIHLGFEQLIKER